MESNTVMPKELRLVTPSTMPQCRSYLFPIQSTEQEYDTGNNVPIVINIPRLARSYLRKDSYIKFRVEMSHTANAKFDIAGAMGLFKTIEVYDYLGSTVLEKIDNVPELWTILLQSNTDLLQNMTSGSMSGGYNMTPTDVNANVWSRGEGQLVYKYTTGGTMSFEFCIPLFCFLGTLSSKYAPLHNGYTIQLTMNSATSAFVSTVAFATTPKLTNIYLNAQILELGPTAEEMVTSSLADDPFVVASNTYRAYRSALKAGSYNLTIPLNLNVASLNSVLLMQRPSSYNQITTSSISNRVRNYLQQVVLKYGSSSLPTTRGVQCGSLPGSKLFAPGVSDSSGNWDLNKDGGFQEAWHEFCKAVRRNPYKSSCNMESSKYMKQSSTTITGINDSQFVVGLSTRLLEDRENDVVCGLNTNGMYTSLELTYDQRDTSGNPTKAVDIAVWAEYNMFVSIAPGVATTVAF